ncbi:hypothetical protein [Acinetobacter sp. CFCC 10889]|uniref:hypothetical protein n=1 Tax=Acinetobacter sp. CFCC 10889 TaxID=1775557 RepID=UPI000DCFB261|nr:hypothetical protein [Acinetobacter sp. CFCC 10889]
MKIVSLNELLDLDYSTLYQEIIDISGFHSKGPLKIFHPDWMRKKGLKVNSFASQTIDTDAIDCMDSSDFFDLVELLESGSSVPFDNESIGSVTAMDHETRFIIFEPSDITLFKEIVNKL